MWTAYEVDLSEEKGSAAHCVLVHMHQEHPASDDFSGAKRASPERALFAASRPMAWRDIQGWIAVEEANRLQPE